MEVISANWHYWVWSALVIGGAAAVALVVHAMLYSAARRLVAKSNGFVDESVIRHSSAPMRLMLPALAVFTVLPGVPLSVNTISFSRHLLALLLIANAAWILIALLSVIEDVLAGKYQLNTAGGLHARRIRTQTLVLRRIAVIIIVAIALSMALMTFPTVWNIGASIFASAGAAGLLAGMAARSTLSNLLAGVQIALTEPIRLEDAVIVEGEFGWIEEIRSTYVVVRIWDLRRLVLPLSYFIEKPFQNWTRNATALLGTVYLYVDYGVPVDVIRSELMNAVKSSPLWDGRVAGLQVTNAGERTLELRAVVSAADSSRLFDLRCLVRERLIGFLQREYPAALPRVRTEISGQMEPSMPQPVP